MEHHEKPPLTLYRNIGKQGIFAETFLKPLNIRKPNAMEAIGNEEITLDKMLEEAYAPPAPPTRELDVQALFDRHRIEVKEENSTSHRSAQATGLFFTAASTLATFSIFF